MIKYIKASISCSAIIFLSGENAFAHGTEILVTIGVQILLIALIITFVLFSNQSIFRKAMFSVLTIVFTGLAWVITENIPYFQNKALINAIHWGTPIVSLGLIVLINRLTEIKQPET